MVMSWEAPTDTGGTEAGMICGQSELFYIWENKYI